MLKLILLLTPVYVTFFWSIVLNSDTKVNNAPRRLLGKFMLFAFVIYLSHFLYFGVSHRFYPFIDPFYQLASLIVYPLYHVYFRLLTVDSRFSLKVHGHYLLPSVLLFFLYILGVVITPSHEYTLWLFDKSLFAESAGIKYLNTLKVLIRFVFLIQVLASIIGNILLIRKHGKKAAEFYSSMDESNTAMVHILNYSMIITGISSLVLGALGRDFFAREIIGIAISSCVFSSMLFLIGWLGNRQKILNPNFELDEDEKQVESLTDGCSTLFAHKVILDKLSYFLGEKKMYLYSKITISDLAQALGTNRTYISSVINQQYNQNFCVFINSYRIEELKNVIVEHPEYTNQLLAESCGFGSIDSMKRAVMSLTNCPLSEWKKQILISAKK